MTNIYNQIVSDSDGNTVNLHLEVIDRNPMGQITTRNLNNTNEAKLTVNSEIEDENDDADGYDSIAKLETFNFDSDGTKLRSAEVYSEKGKYAGFISRSYVNNIGYELICDVDSPEGDIIQDGISAFQGISDDDLSPFMATEPEHVATKAYVDSSGGITIQDVKDLLSDDYQLRTEVEDSERCVNFGDKNGLDLFVIDIAFDNSNKPDKVSSKTSGEWASNKIDLHVTDSEVREGGESYGYMQIEDDPSSSERFVATLGSWNQFNDKRSFIKAYQTERGADSVATLEIQGDDVRVEDTNGDPFVATEPSHVATKAYVDQLQSYLRALSDVTGARINKIVKVTDTGDREGGNKIYEIELEYYNGSAVPVDSIGNNYTIGYTNTFGGYVRNRDLYIQDNKFRVVAQPDYAPAVNSWARIDKPETER